MSALPRRLHLSRVSTELTHPCAPCCHVKLLKAGRRGQIYGRPGTSLADAETSSKRPVEKDFLQLLMMRVARAGVGVDCGGGGGGSGDATERKLWATAEAYINSGD